MEPFGSLDSSTVAFHGLLGATVSILSIMIISVIMRFYRKLNIEKAWLWDDWACLFATVGTVGFSVTSLLAVDKNENSRLWDVGIHDVSPIIRNRILILDVFYAFSSLQTKMSLLLFILRKYKSSIELKVLICFTMLLTCIIYTGTLVIVGVLYATKSRHGQTQTIAVGYVQGVFSVASDALILLLAIPASYKLDLLVLKKLGLLALLGFGVVANFSASQGLYCFILISTKNNIGSRIVYMLLWLIVELALGVTCGCLASLPAVFDYHRASMHDNVYATSSSIILSASLLREHSLRYGHAAITSPMQILKHQVPELRMITLDNRIDGAGYFINADGVFMAARRPFLQTAPATHVRENIASPANDLHQERAKSVPKRRRTSRPFRRRQSSIGSILRWWGRFAVPYLEREARFVPQVPPVPPVPPLDLLMRPHTMMKGVGVAQETKVAPPTPESLKLRPKKLRSQNSTATLTRRWLSRTQSETALEARPSRSTTHSKRNEQQEKEVASRNTTFFLDEEAALPPALLPPPLQPLHRPVSSPIPQATQLRQYPVSRPASDISWLHWYARLDLDADTRPISPERNIAQTAIRLDDANPQSHEPYQESTTEVDRFDHPVPTSPSSQEIRLAQSSAQHGKRKKGQTSKAHTRTVSQVEGNYQDVSKPATACSPTKTHPAHKVTKRKTRGIRYRKKKAVAMGYWDVLDEFQAEGNCSLLNCIFAWARKACFRN